MSRENRTIKDKICDVLSYIIISLLFLIARIIPIYIFSLFFGILAVILCPFIPTTYLVLKNLKENTISKAFDKAIDDSRNTTNLTDEDARVLKLLSKQLGNTDIEGQVSQIEITENFLDVQIKQAQEEKDKNQKLYQKLGTTIGLVIVILLV